MSSAIKSTAKNVAKANIKAVTNPFGITEDITGYNPVDLLGGALDNDNGTLTGIDVDDSTATDQYQEDVTNAARIADAAKKKKKTSSSVLTSPLGASTAKTAVTKLGGM